MYYLAKIFQATGLAVIALGFMAAFPRLMNTRVLLVGIVTFTMGWMMGRFLLHR